MIRLLLADDEALIRDALASLLDLEDDVEVVARAASADEAVDAARVHRPDVALLDLQMPVRGRTDAPDGIDAATRILAADPRVATVVVTSHGRPGYLKRALEAGVRGFLPKTVPSRVLADVVRQVHAGGRYVDPELAAEAIATGGSPLTAREADVLELAADGSPVEQIAARVHLAPGTVRNHLSSAVAKLGVTNRHEAVALARRNGWV
ncbi:MULTISPECIES: response regulator transcription factor [Cellulomonas]|uniref:response regulator transcription factor n=2 Tax=Cellulomonadaceae TaxID=85016 RepID=UPI00062670B9|nr:MULTISPECIES: response regulator transcription factor [Cellulomonas]KSW23787.1 LuxR family transcriptional regulator [Cellulomonas sp. B6]UCN15682.1 response regulator transcription factor [Cellulomonas iranensis]